MNTSSAILQRANDFARSHSLMEIERYADHLKSDARELERYSTTLASLPEYETNAEAAVVSAIAALHESLRKTADAYSAIMAKRTENQKD